MGNQEAVEIYKQTQQIVLQGFYEINGTKINLNIDKNLINQNYQVDNSEFYFKSTVKQQLNNKMNQSKNTKILIINNDCLISAKQLKDKFKLNPVVLNMANPEKPGGGVEIGAMAQEENIFRRSNYFQHLCQDNQQIIKYPISLIGAIYSPNVTIFRDEQGKKYELLQQPYTLSFIAAAALECPDLNENYRLNAKDEQITIEKVKTILALAAFKKHNCVVLGALGCGAFNNPPLHIAEIFKNVIEQYFANVFDIIAISIILNEENLKSFEQIFQKQAININEKINWEQILK